MEKISTSFRHVIVIAGPDPISLGVLGGFVFASSKIKTSFRYVIDISGPDPIFLGELEGFLVLW